MLEWKFFLLLHMFKFQIYKARISILVNHFDQQIIDNMSKN